MYPTSSSKLSGLGDWALNQWDILKQQPVIKTAGVISDIADKLYRGNTSEEEGWKIAGVPFSPGAAPNIKDYTAKIDKALSSYATAKSRIPSFPPTKEFLANKAIEDNYYKEILARLNYPQDTRSIFKLRGLGK